MNYNNNRDMILIVDDIETNRIILEEILKDTYETKLACGGKTAIELAMSDDAKPSMILLDIMMPEMNGYEVLEIIKNNPATEHIPVIFITAADSYADETKGLALGAVDYISKPFNAEIVKARVATQLRLYHYSVKLEDMVRQKVNELILSKEKMLDVMANVIEYRSVESGQHVKRTRDLTYILAKYLCENPEFGRALTVEEADIIAKASPLHDVGKIAIPDNVLLKNGVLTTEEYEIMKTHSMLGGNLVLLMMQDAKEGDAYLECCYDIAMFHHERWDGKGYPHGAMGEEIPLAARIVTLVDVYDALIGERAYKTKMSHAEAVSIIREGAGTQFDDKITEAFLMIHDKFEEYVKANA